MNIISFVTLYKVFYISYWMHPPPINYTKMGPNLNRRNHKLFLTGFDFLNQKAISNPKNAEPKPLKR